jgi:folate-binding protein YgfZ
MTQTAHLQRLALPAAQLGGYLGVETALSFGNPPGELQALLSGCAVFDLGWRARITVSGNDRTRWLHNMVTNNIRDLVRNHGNYNFVLNAQGRILGDLYVFNRGDNFLIETDRTQVETLLTSMKRFIIMDKVEMAESPAMVALGVCGPNADQVLIAAGIDIAAIEPLELRDVTTSGIKLELVRGPQTKQLWYEIWCEPASARTIWDLLARSGAQPVGAQALDWWRILQGIPQFGQDIRDRDLPHETGQVQALNFNKGCYIGQEIVERIRSRGQVHRQFTGFEFSGELPQPGKFEAEGKVLAEITTTATVPLSGGEKKIGLGYVRREVAEVVPRVDLNGHAAGIVSLPFTI